MKFEELLIIIIISSILLAIDQCNKIHVAAFQGWLVFDA